MFLKNISFHGVLLENIQAIGHKDWSTVHHLLQEGIEAGVVKPLKVYPYGKTQLEEAFRFMAEGKHAGKIVIKVCNRVLPSLSWC